MRNVLVRDCGLRSALIVATGRFVVTLTERELCLLLDVVEQVLDGPMVGSWTTEDVACVQSMLAGRLAW